MSKIPLICIFALFVLVAGLLGGSWPRAGGEAGFVGASPQGIASFAPSITETLYALGLGERVAGVTEHCLWPPEAALKPKIGGFMEVSLEALVRSGAELAALPQDLVHYRAAIENLGIPVLIFGRGSLKAYLEDAKTLGALCGREQEAAEFAAPFERAIREGGAGAKIRAVFALAGGGDDAREITLIGADGFYNDVLAAAGAENAYRGATPYPRVSPEALFRLDPDLLIVAAQGRAAAEKFAQDLRERGAGKFAEPGRLLILDEAGDTIPGPRALKAIGKIAKAARALRSVK